MTIAAEHFVTTQDELTELYGEPTAAVTAKAIPALDVHCRAFIANAPFAVLATSGPDGTCDASPRGGEPGFCDVVGPTTIVLPDQPGNKRLDSVRNIVATGHAGLIFMVPRVRETLRVNGRAAISRDPDLLARYADGGRPPISAIVVEVQEAYLHCAKAFIRSGLWDPASWREPEGLASAAQIFKDHLHLDIPVETLQSGIDADYVNGLRWDQSA